MLLLLAIIDLFIILLFPYCLWISPQYKNHCGRSQKDFFKKGNSQTCMMLIAKNEQIDVTFTGNTTESIQLFLLWF